MAKPQQPARSSTEPKENGSAQNRTFDFMESLVTLQPKTLQVEPTVGDGLILRCPECGEKTGVMVEPCFPLTRPGKFLIFHDRDGKELGMLEDIAALPDRFRQVLREEFAKQHFLPIIVRIDAIYRQFQIPIWQVQTDHGPRRLELKTRHDAHRLSGGRIYVRDAEGNSYLIPDYRKLDRASQRLLELHV